MKKTLIWIGIIAIIALWGISAYNGLVNKDEAVTAAWGQVDSILALLCLLMVWFITKDKYMLASVMFGLAVSYALLGKKVVLCGLDIRKPALGALFGLHDHKKGISVLLPMTEVTAADVMEQIQPSGVNRHLDLLLAGPVPPNSTELLARDSLRQIIGILKESYDYVILDTAPIGLVTDTFQVVSLADVTVYVCRVGYTPKYAIGQLNGLKDEKKLPNPCIVLNGC